MVDGRERLPLVEASVVELAVGDLVPHPRNGVFRQLSEGEVDELAASLAERGFIHPLVVRPLGDGRCEVLSGHQRLRAAERLGLERVPCRVVEADDTEAELIVLDANITTRQLGPMELARAIRRKKELMGERRGRPINSAQNERDFVGETAELLAGELGISRAQVNRYDALNELIAPLQDLVDAGALGVTAGASLARLPEEVQQALWAALGEAVGQIKVDEVRRLREEHQRAGVVVAALARQVEQLEARLREAEAAGQQAGDLRHQIERLRAQKRELEMDVQDRLALRRQLERRPGARFLELVAEAARVLGRVRPELESTYDRLRVSGGLDAATVANLQAYVRLFREVADLVEAAAGGGPPLARVGGGRQPVENMRSGRV